LPTAIDFVTCDIFGNSGRGIYANGVQDFSVTGSRIAGNTIAGIETNASTGSVTEFSLQDNTIASTAGFGVNGTGLLINAGTYKSYRFSGNDFQDNTTPITDNGSVVRGKSTTGNLPSPLFDPIVVPGTPSATTSTADVYGLQFTLPANTLVTGSQVEFELMGLVTNGATAATLNCFIMIAGTKYAVTGHALTSTVTGGRPWLYRGSLTFKTVGASGTFYTETKYEGSSTGFGAPSAAASAANFTAYAASATTATTLSTTADIAVKVGVAMNLAISTAVTIISGHANLSSPR
jgi:hypothetical protein